MKHDILLVIAGRALRHRAVRPGHLRFAIFPPRRNREALNLADYLAAAAPIIITAPLERARIKYRTIVLVSFVALADGRSIADIKGISTRPNISRTEKPRTTCFSHRVSLFLSLSFSLSLTISIPFPAFLRAVKRDGARQR